MISCPHRPPCPGCPRFGAGAVAPAARAALDELARECGLPPPDVLEGAPFGWRVRARLAVRGRARSPKIGLFRAGTHQIVDTPTCRIHHPLVNDVVAALKRAIRETGTPPYQDGAHRGLVRYVQIVVERTSSRAQVVVVCNDDSPDRVAPLCAVLAGVLGERLHSLWWNGQPEESNTIIGPHWHHVLGDESVRERIGGVDVHFPPGAFGQANLDLADGLVEIVGGWLGEASPVADIYAGCGALGLPLLARGARVHFVERGIASLRGLALGLAALPEQTRRRARVHAGDAGSAAVLQALRANCRSMVVDPPRRGLDRSLLEALRSDPPEQLVYVSCGLPAFRLQARELLESGRMRLSGLHAAALFPHTDHVETLARFERV
ncbi:MAG: class I SAM-dependent RNA methyltransferase [Deltaproteobacteria bacterium]|nr:class I SAM-dependent RNA methyltransferase [Deltaproteobacteria bacterium]